MRNVLLVYLWLKIHWAWCQEYGDYNYVRPVFDWCCLKCEGPHLLCPPALNKMVTPLLSEITVDNLVKEINIRREELSRRAMISNMNYLRISEKLTAMAEHLVGYCNSLPPTTCFDTDDYEVKMLTFNASLRVHNTTEPSDIVDYWMRGRIEYLTNYHDRYYFNFTPINNETDDFTLITWAQTSEIGCAEGYYSNSTFQITCLLGPGGNIIGAAVWERGNPCTNCSTVEDKTRKRISCVNSSCYIGAPTWPRDPIRLARCNPGFPDPDFNRIFIQDEAPYASGVTVLLKPRYICDPISEAHRPTNIGRLKWLVIVMVTITLKK